MLAAHVMDPGLQAFFFIAAFVVFVIATFANPPRWNLVAAGLALVTIVWAWNALAAA